MVYSILDLFVNKNKEEKLDRKDDVYTYGMWQVKNSYDQGMSMEQIVDADTIGWIGDKL